MQIHTAAGSCTGKVRINNEDQFLLDGRMMPMDHTDAQIPDEILHSDRPVLMGVFDGMGGHARGERASFLAAATAARWAENLQAENLERQLLNICMDANDAVCREDMGERMGTTAVMLCMLKDRYALCNIGDSPAFLLRGGKMECITQEHTQRAMYERINGRTRVREKFPLTQYIGIPADEMLIEPYIRCGLLRDGDVFLLCSDGITDMLTQEQIYRILESVAEPNEMVQRLIGCAMEAGGKDNITAVCVKLRADKSTFMQRAKDWLL